MSANGRHTPRSATKDRIPDTGLRDGSLFKRVEARSGDQLQEEHCWKVCGIYRVWPCHTFEGTWSPHWRDTVNESTKNSPHFLVFGWREAILLHGIYKALINKYNETTYNNWSCEVNLLYFIGLSPKWFR